MSQHRLVNPLVRNIRALKRGALVRQAVRIEEEIKQGMKKPYNEVIDVSRDNPHATGMKPMSFSRQVIASCIYPELIDSDKMPLDVRERAKTLLECIGGSVGCYSDTIGIPIMRDSVSDFLTRRDEGVPSASGNIFITHGSDHGFGLLLTMLVRGDRSPLVGVLTPVPSQDFGNALVASGATAVPYYLDGQQGWRLHTEELQRALRSAREVCDPIALYVINPGDPTGHVQSRESMEEIIRFVYEEKLLLFANEDHQDILIGEGCMFISYKKVLAEMGSPFSDAVELASIHSASKGFMGEGGLHGGYLELVNFDPSVQIEFDRLISLLGLPIIGQLALEVMLNPLQPGEPSYEQYQEEIQHIRETLVHNVTRAFEVLDSLPGISCEPINGGASMFPRLHLPHIAIHQAKEEEKLPDFFYCSRLLEQTGLCVCPGSDLGLPEGTYHIRLCIMTSVDTMEEVLRRLGKFHKQFMKDFS
ncbi:alanine aminotransferase 2-like isoform X1 [Gadus morhua]|uniref:alanine aminotransferase 2-like isoform X1 n=1 Tax=Gadus morhua TaxID=8049 RepID=UPI0011B78D99|nr:alanine aminotransferase 2-like isoform X1 [Gadus morhua]